MCLTSADIDPRAPISSPMGGARGLLGNPKVAMFRSVPGGSMDLWARHYVEKPFLYIPPHPLVHRPTRGRTADSHLGFLSRPLAPPMGRRWAL